MNRLLIYPTSRALRAVSATLKEQSSLLPTLMRMDEFEHRAILLDEKSQVDEIDRILLLREAASFEAFEDLKLNLELVRFFTKSDAIFKFFEELAVEQIDFHTLAKADAYAEFEAHLQILERLLKNYHKLLEEQGLTDKAFIPGSYSINEGFIKNYECIEIHLEGYLSHFELELIEKVSQMTTVILHYSTSKFNLKMQERFDAYGLSLPNNADVIVDFSSKKLLSHRSNRVHIDAEILAVEERQEQIAVAFMKIEEMVRSGILPENIVLILPDESFKESFALYDRYNNLNFAMGYDYSRERIYKSLEALYLYWQTFDSKSRLLLERYGFSCESIDKINPSKECGCVDFFTLLDEMKLLDCPLELVFSEGDELKQTYNERVYEKYLHFLKIFKRHTLTTKEWLFLWMKALGSITLDDVRGGKITVMGVLETRGVSFEGVVIVDFNEGVVPATSSKDQFLNSTVRAFAKLPTKNDREALQKQYYKRLLEQAKRAVVLYSTSDNRLPSKFLYELGLDTAEQTKAQFDLLYAQSSQLVDENEPVVENFDAQAITWSASRLKTYLECKRKYYYRYIQKIEAKKEEELNEGAFLHTLLDHLYAKKNVYQSYEELEESLHRLLDRLLPMQDAKTAYKKLLFKEKLKGFIASQIYHFKAGWRVVEREYEVLGEIGGLRFKGRIDRIDQDNTHTLVLDYKSGSTKEAQKRKNLESLTDFQMSIYHQLLAPRYSNLNLAFVKIFEDGKIEEITELEEKNKLLTQHIIELKQSKSFVAKRCEDLQKCTYCEFTLMCERGEYL